jgi:hypothetical protein
MVLLFVTACGDHPGGAGGSGAGGASEAVGSGGAGSIGSTGGAGGTHLWSKRFGDDNGQIARLVAVDPAGDVLLAGDFIGVLDFGGNPLDGLDPGDLFVAKLDGATGGHVWSARYGAVQGIYPKRLAADAAGDVVLAGSYWAGTLDLGGLCSRARRISTASWSSSRGRAARTSGRWAWARTSRTKAARAWRWTPRATCS